MSKKKILSTRWKIAIGFGIFGLFGIVVVVRLVVQAYNDFQNFPALHLKKVSDMPGEDSALFSNESWSKMTVDFGWKDINRQVSFLTFDRRYQVIVEKSPLAGASALHSLVKLEFGDGKETNFINYQPTRLDDHGDFCRRYTPLMPISNILITYSGDIAETVVSNDSVLQYRIPCENLSIRYAVDSPVDMYLTNGNINSNKANLRLDVVMVRRRAELYFLFILPIDYRQAIEPINISELLNKDSK